MKEEISVRGKMVWIPIEPHTLLDHQLGQEREYNDASDEVSNLADMGNDAFHNSRNQISKSMD